MQRRAGGGLVSAGDFSPALEPHIELQTPPKTNTIVLPRGVRNEKRGGILSSEESGERERGREDVEGDG